MRSTIRIDHSGRKLQDVRKHLRDAYLEVGILRGQYKPDGDKSAQYVAQVAAQNEYGHGRIPSRPFMRNAMRQHKKDILRQLRNVAVSELHGKSAGTQMTRLGLMSQNWVRSEITTLRTPPNAPMTIARKRSSNPLIDTGRMRQEIQFQVIDKSGDVV